MQTPLSTDRSSKQAHATASSETKPKVIELKDVSRTYKRGKTTVAALEAVSFDIHEGEMVAIVGTSGSGKSTLLQIIGGLDTPTRGAVYVDGANLTKMSDQALSAYRGKKIGFVFQSFYLQPFLKTQDNIEIPAIFARTRPAIRHTESEKIAQAVGIADRLQHLPSELSGGQIQRASIARALMNRPKILLADEPTGNLDQTNARAIFDLFREVRDTYGTTVIVVTHDNDLAARMDRTIRISDGKVSL